MKKSTGSQNTSIVDNDAALTVDLISASAKGLSRAITRFSQSSMNSSERATVLRGIKEKLDQLMASVPQVELILADVEQKANEAFNQLDADIRDAFGARGWRCDGEWPTLYVERAVQVQIDEKMRNARVGGVKVRAASVDDIIESLIPIVKALVPVNFAADQFLDSVALAYDDVVRASTLVPIFDAYRALVIRTQKPTFWRNATQAEFIGLSADQFRARLSEALSRGVAAVADGRQLRLLPPLDAKEGLFVYQPAERRFAFVGRIEFARVD